MTDWPPVTLARLAFGTDFGPCPRLALLALLPGLSREQIEEIADDLDL